jgi:hypothetical protein
MFNDHCACHHWLDTIQCTDILVFLQDNHGEAVIPSLLSSDGQGSNNPANLESELSDFRSQWRQELSTRSPRGAEPTKDLQRDNYIMEQVSFIFVFLAGTLYFIK